MSDEIEGAAPPAGDPPAEQPQADAGDPPAGEGLKKALDAERKARAQAESRLRELERSAAKQAKTIEERIAAIEAERDALRRATTIQSAVDAAVAEVGDGYTVDPAVVRRQAERLRDDADVGEAVADLVAALRRPVAVQAGKPATPQATDPTGGKTLAEMTGVEMAEFARRDPEGYAAARAGLASYVAWPTTPTLGDPYLLRGGTGPKPQPAQAFKPRR